MGPEPDKDHSRGGAIWVFGKTIKGHEIYIKLKLAEVNGKSLAKCISFHKANLPITYPLRR
jgi:hypothetical protein